jgi:hypothetical protein
MWSVLDGLAFVLGAALITFGAWLIVRPRRADWMKGFWKWPLGRNLNARVLRMQGWASALIGVACWVASGLHSLTPRSAAAWSAITVDVVVVVGALVLYVRSVMLSRRDPT